MPNIIADVELILSDRTFNPSSINAFGRRQLELSCGKGTALFRSTSPFKKTVLYTTTFGDRGAPRSLLVFIDDATGKLMQLRFVPSESTESYFGVLHGYLKDHRCPVAFYSDKHTVFRVNKRDAKGVQGMTQFGRALAEFRVP